MAVTFDLLVIGDDAPSLCAAAAAAAGGASTALAATGAVTYGGPSVCDIPNFVWRRLDLQEFGLETEPVSARITLLADGQTTTTYRSLEETVDALREVDADGAALWPEMTDDMRALGESGLAAGVSGTAPNTLSLMSDMRAFADLGRVAGSGEELVEDYVNGGPLNAHINAHALAPFGLGGVEAGSAAALPEFFDEHAWRVRAKSGARSIIGALRKACERNGVATTPAGVEKATADGAKHNSITFKGGEKVRSRYIFFACPDAAEAAGYGGAGQGGPPVAAPANGARAVMRIKLRDRVAPPVGDSSALFQIVDDGSDLKDARAAALGGRIFDRMPVEFEFTDKGDIVARTSYVPKRLQEEGEWRDWTGQDRQLLSTILLNRLVSRIDGLQDQIRKTDLKVVDRTVAGDEKFAGARNVVLQPRRHDAIAAAVTLIDKVLADD